MTPAIFAVTVLLAWPATHEGHPGIRTFEWIGTRYTLPPTYRMRHSGNGRTWCEADKIEVPATACVYRHPENFPWIRNRCVMDFYVTTGRALDFIVVTEVADGVEGPTEHGAVVACP